MSNTILRPPGTTTGHPCTVCNHPMRGAIEAELYRGAQYRSIMGRFALSKAMLVTHKRHLSAAVKVETEAQGITREWVSDQIASLVPRCRRFLDELEAIQNDTLVTDHSDQRIAKYRALFAAIPALGGELERLARLNGWLVQKIELTISQEWQDRVRAAELATPEATELAALAYLREALLKRGKRLVIMGVEDEIEAGGGNGAMPEVQERALPGHGSGGEATRSGPEAG